MLPEMPEDLREAQALGISLFAGEAEGRLDAGPARRRSRERCSRSTISWTTCRASRARRCRILPVARIARTAGTLSSFDAGRGCPFQCSFCTIINVQGRKSRYRSPDDVEAIMRANLAQGVQPLLHHRRQLRPQPELGGDLRPADPSCAKTKACASRSFIQVDTLCHRIPALHRKGRAGRREARLHRAGEHQSRKASWRPRRSRTASPNTGRCCWPGSASAASPMPATSSASPATRRKPSCATSASSSANCRSICWSSSA